MIRPRIHKDSDGSAKDGGAGEIAGIEENDYDTGGGIDPDKWNASMERVERDRENPSLESSDDDEPGDFDNHERAESEPQSHED